MLFIQNSFEISYEFMKYRDVLEWKSGKMVMFMKNAQCPSTMKTNLSLCDHIYPHMVTGISHIICSY